MTTTTTTTSHYQDQNNNDETPILAATRHLLKPNGSIVGSQVAQIVRANHATFLSAVAVVSTARTATEQQQQQQRDCHHPALASIDGRTSVSHARVVEFGQALGGTLQDLGIGRGDRVALVLPNGPELALALLAVAHWATAVPLNANGAASELQADLLRCGAKLVIGPGGGVTTTTTTSSTSTSSTSTSTILPSKFHVPSAASSRQDWSTAFGFVQETADALGIAYATLIPSETEAGIFTLQAGAAAAAGGAARAAASSTATSTTTPSTINKAPEPNHYDDDALVLFTSGTTGNKKLVPHCMGDLLTAAVTIALSWDLTSDDVNCNLMPLFHVGGIVRQVFSPMISGGCVICCPAFDPAIFWELLQKQAFTWYYAAPTMHHLILQLGKSEGLITAASNNNNNSSSNNSNKYKLRMIANAAGGLLPSLAEEMRDTFQANILPSYGMTECMPISSPPANYQLEKPGTSGVPVGPEVAILNTASGASLPQGVEGPICVRGEPCFRGYGRMADQPDEAVPEAFMPGGWFNTGDLGYMDADGYLYITGRSKEVINRGGEIIAPFEVEQAVTQHPDVITCAAFSAPHKVLQEVVGIVVVTKNPRRLDMTSLHEFLGDKLANPKWPQCLVFMDGDLPKSHTNKVLRTKLGERLGLPELTDEMTALERTWEASCPPQGTSLDVPIQAKQVAISAIAVEKTLQTHLETSSDRRVTVVAHPTRANALVCYLVNIDRKHAIETAMNTLDRYSVPTHFVESTEYGESLKRNQSAPSLADAVVSILQGPSSGANEDPVVVAVQAMFAEILSLDFLPSPEKNFFHLGGSSLVASQLASRIRKKFSVPCNGSEVFQHPTALSMAKLVRQRSDSLSSATDATQDSSSVDSSAPNDHGAPFASKRLPMQSSWAGSLFQLTPMFVLFPIWQVSRYLLFFRLLLWSIDNTPASRDIGTFIIAYLAFHFCWITVTPLVFVAIKWIVIGRYRAGRYPIWGSYYLRWWFVDICRKLFLRGIWGSHDVLLNAYYRMLGAKIGKGAKISPECTMAEFDLVNIGENAMVEMATVRGFGVDNGAMILGDITLEKNSSVGWKSVVAPYTRIPQDCHLGPATSSYNVGDALASKHRRVNRRAFAEPSLFLQVFVGGPITFLVNSFGQIPPFFVLFLMLQIKTDEDAFTCVGDLMKWLCQLDRIPYFIGIRVVRNVLTPFFYMAAAIFVKWTLIGKFEAGPRDENDQWDLLRHWLSATLFSRKKIQTVTDLIGRHYELVSILYRLLGAKVGKRVFWPGHQPVFSGEFDLIEIGDDVVFGSRCAILTATTDSYKKVTLGAGANVSDNCTVLPGSIVGKSAVLGSNSVCPEGWYLPPGSLWFGSKNCEPICLEWGSEPEVDALGEPLLASEKVRQQVPMQGDASTLRPFGKAFYQNGANYFVFPLSLIVAYSFVCKMLVVMLHTLPLLGALHLAAATLYGWRFSDRQYGGLQYHFSTVYWVWLFFYIWTNMVRVGAWLAIELTAKWMLMGRRQPGKYNYDTSSYAQRWELYQIIAKVRKFSRMTFLDFFSGTPFMAQYFRWNGATIGRNCCIYPAGADPFMPEPDLVTMGNGVVVDCASIVCHLNTRGNFELRPIVLDDETTLRSRARLQSGVHMQVGSQLLEKSLAMTGEVIEAYSVWQGCPSSWWFQYSNKKLLDEEESATSSNETTSLLRGSSVQYV